MFAPHYHAVSFRESIRLSRSYRTQKLYTIYQDLQGNSDIFHTLVFLYINTLTDKYMCDIRALLIYNRDITSVCILRYSHTNIPCKPVYMPRIRAAYTFVGIHSFGVFFAVECQNSCLILFACFLVYLYFIHFILLYTLNSTNCIPHTKYNLYTSHKVQSIAPKV